MFAKKKSPEKTLTVTASELKTVTTDNLYQLFTSEKWNAMGEDSRLCALQEMENRRAAADGRPPVKVVRGDADKFSSPGLLGYYADDKREIHLNYRFLSQPSYQHGGASALSTLLHEGRHAYQHFATRQGVSNTSPDVLKEWLSSQSHYLSGGGSPLRFALYTLQSIEDDARRFARRQMQQIMNSLLLRGINCAGFFAEYRDTLQEEDRNIRRIKEFLTIEELEKQEKLVLKDLQKKFPDLDTKKLLLFDNARLILEAKLDNTDDLLRLLGRLDQMADQKLNQLDQKPLNRIHNALNRMR